MIIIIKQNKDMIQTVKLSCIKGSQIHLRRPSGKTKSLQLSGPPLRVGTFLTLKGSF